ncbi:MAG: 16S rRNA (guanine(527)-N(7))-methyltransferase RsmG [Myxococcota bacterium]
MSDLFRRTFCEEAARLGLVRHATLLDGLTAHYDLLLRWAPRMNLTAITDPEEAAVLHAVDSLLFDLLLDPTADTLVDVGSGAGFPGIPLALARPKLKVTLLEPLGKRTSFLRVVVARLKLSNVKVVDGRLDPGRAPPIAPVSVAVSRATLNPLEWVERSPMVASGSVLMSGGRQAPDVKAIEEVGARVGLVHDMRRTFTLRGDVTRVLDRLRTAG